MIYPKYIASSKNKQIKKLKSIMINPENFEKSIFVEGLRYLNDFFYSKYYKLIRWFIFEKITLDREKLSFFDPEQVTFISEEVAQYLSDVTSNQGFFGLFERTYSIEVMEEVLSQETFILDSIGDPGNLGTIIRTAVALERKHIILVDGSVNPFCPKVIRSSGGLISKIKIIRGSLENITLLFKNKSFLCIAMDAKGEKLNFATGNKKKLENKFVILGNEAHGISSYWQNYISNTVALPMSSLVESLNVAVAGSIIGYYLWSECFESNN